MNAIILKGAALRQPPLPQSGPRTKTIGHPYSILIPVSASQRLNFTVKLLGLKMSIEGANENNRFLFE
jgi:hypothetical protein